MAKGFGSIEQLVHPSKRPPGYSFEDIPDGAVEVDAPQAGMVTRLSRGEASKESARDLKNARVRDDWVGRRPGTQVFGPTKPDSKKVLKVISFIHEDGSVFLVRITDEIYDPGISSGVYVANISSSTWTEFAVLDTDGNPDSFPTNARISHAQYFNWLYLADGSNPIWELDFEEAVVQQIEGAPTAKYITNFGNRIVAANIGLKVGGQRPNGIAWSANADPRIWSGLGTGSFDLSESEIGNFITGIVGFEDLAVVVRRKSVLHLTRQPFADNPFRPTTVIPSLGCDLPHTIARVTGGMCWGDQRTKEVYYYSPGARPAPIASVVNADIMEDLRSLEFAEGTFDPFQAEYHLGLAESGGTDIGKVWVLALRKNRAWSYDDGPEVSTLGVVSLPGTYVAIDELSGSIDSQTGSIDDYGSEGDFDPALFKGTATGEILRQTYAAANDWDGTAFEFTFQSPNLGSVSRRRTLKALIAAVDVDAVGTYVLEHSTDETNWRNTKTITFTATGVQRIQQKRPITGDDLYWRVRSSSDGFKIHSWMVRIIEKGLQRA